MLSRGRVSAAARSVLATARTPELVARPEPPSTLNADEAKVWRVTVKVMPPGWFPYQTHALLEGYCRQVAGLPYIDGLLAAAKKANNMVEWRKLVSLRRLELKSIALLATKMRLAQQSSYDYKTAQTAKNKMTRAANKVSEPISPWS
jgi:hypothetical protein